jgi:hypothetical protein
MALAPASSRGPEVLGPLAAACLVLFVVTNRDMTEQWTGSRPDLAHVRSLRPLGSAACSLRCLGEPGHDDMLSRRSLLLCSVPESAGWDVLVDFGTRMTVQEPFPTRITNFWSRPRERRTRPMKGQPA